MKIVLCTVLLSPASYATDLSLAAAIEQALVDNHSIRLQRINQLSAQTAVLSASSEFDPRLSTSISVNKAKIPLTSGEKTQLESLDISHLHINDSTSYSLSASQKTAHGVTYTGSLSSQYSSDSLAELQGGKSSVAGIVSFKLSTALNRSHKADVVQAQLSSAEKNVYATQLQVLSNVNNLVADIGNAYWSLVAARQRKAITEASVQSMQSLLRDMNTLVKNDEIPRAELDLIQASLAEKKANSQSASLQTLSAEHQLALLLSQSQYTGITLVHKALPDISNITVQALPHTELNWQRLIQEHRDSRALKAAIESQNMLRKFAQNNVRNPVNLSVELSYRSLTEDSDPYRLGNIYANNNEGPSIGVNIEWLFPFKNTAARAQLRDSELKMESIQIQLKQQQFILRHNLQLSYDTARSNQAQLNQQKLARV